jgi:hypothetical protein
MYIRHTNKRRKLDEKRRMLSYATTTDKNSLLKSKRKTKTKDNYRHGAIDLKEQSKGRADG